MELVIKEVFNLLVIMQMKLAKLKQIKMDISHS